VHGALVRVGVVLGMLAGPASPRDVRPGIEVLLSDSVRLVRGLRVGLVSNQAGVGRAGVHDVELLLHAGVRLVALFAPEHGFRGTADPGAPVASTVDSATGLPIYSLYGSSPKDETLAGIDVMLVDLPDVGARYYSYLWTTVEVMRAAHRLGKRVVVLDRPNPIGAPVQGNVLDPHYRSAIGLLAVPIRHGMTLGELARLANRDLEIGARLSVVPAAGWRRRDDQERTGLPFLAPSPNLRDLEGLYHYPGTCLFEGTALSVGRGSDLPYHQIGAPWLDTTAVLARVRREGLTGVRFEGVTFKPERPGDGKYAGVTVAGIRLVLTDRARYDPVRTALILLTVIRAVHPDRIGWNNAFDRLAGGPSLRQAIQAGTPPDSILASWRGPIRRFLQRRKPFLLYRE